MSVAPLDPAPPACPLCGGSRWMVLRFFATAPVAILTRCAGCGVLRMHSPAGTALPVEAPARDLPAGMSRMAGRDGQVIVAPIGTALPPGGGATTWTGGGGPTDPTSVHLWLSLEESGDPVAALRHVRFILRARGHLAVTAADGRRWRRVTEPGRHRFLYGPAQLRRVLALGGFTATVRSSWWSATLTADAVPVP